MVISGNVRMRMAVYAALVASVGMGSWGCSSSDDQGQQQEAVEGSDDEEKASADGDAALNPSDAGLPVESGSDEQKIAGSPVEVPKDPASAASSLPMDDVAGPTKSSVGAGEQSYTVVAGDWLSKIAHSVYGDAKKWKQIAEANPQLKDPNRIFPGEVLKIPAAH